MADLSGIDATGLVGSAGAAYALQKIAGPALDEIGEALRRFSEYRLRNVGKIAEAADRKSANAAHPDGFVSPRVAMRIFEEGSYSDNQIVVEYLGGVLASSKSDDGQDDRGNSWATLVARMSSYQLKAHYLIYRAIRAALDGYHLHPMDGRDLRQMAIFVPEAEWYDCLELSQNQDAEPIITHIFGGLQRDQLITDFSGSSRVYWSETSGDGMIFTPTLAGLELFLWGTGHGNESLTGFLDVLPSNSFDIDGVRTIERSRSVELMRGRQVRAAHERGQATHSSGPKSPSRKKNRKKK